MQERGARYGEKSGRDTYKELLRMLDEKLEGYNSKKAKLK